jgi:ABC-type multidrug transport system fused ATPase/permease subunit
LESDTKELSTWYTIQRLSGFAKPYWLQIGIAFAIMSAQIVTELLKPWPLKFVLDSVITREALDGPTLYLLIGVAALVVFVSVFDGLLSYWQTYHLNSAARYIVFDLRGALFDHVQRLSLQYHSRKRTGDLMTRVTSDVGALSSIFTGSLVQVAYAVLYLTGMVVVLLILDWKVAFVAFVAAPLFYAIALRFTSRIKRLARLERWREGSLTSVLHESLGTIRLTRAYNQEEAARAKFEEESRTTAELGLETTMTGAKFGWVVGVLKSIVTAIVLGYGAQRVITGHMTPGELYLFVSYTRSFYKPVQTTMKHIVRLSTASARGERVVELLDEKEGVADRQGAVPAPPLAGQVEYRGVSFAYESEPILHDISFAVQARKVTALVGATGAGKTTVAALVPRLYDPTDGVVLIDGRDVRDYTLASLRGQISMVLQESVLFRASITENIAYGRPSATLDEIVEAAKAANAHDFIMQLPDGYETIIGERGETLSGGQRQRIAIARAMVRNAPILILDEPLVGLDAHSALSVLEALHRLMENKTVIVITHDLATVQRADYVVLLDEGRIKQQGPVRELASADGPYRELLKAQFGEIAILDDPATVRR